MENQQQKSETIVLGGGCFWCMEAVFQNTEGVRSVTSGYAGGRTENPTYEEVCTGETGHAEVVRIEFDPERIELTDLLELFWKSHDPTTPNRQGADIGSQYRSVILYSSAEQKKIAMESRTRAAHSYQDPIVTEILPLRSFFPAEEYHQNFYRNNPQNPYCIFVIRPKLQKMESHPSG